MSNKKKILTKVIIYPLLAIFTVVSFTFVLFVLLPAINNVAITAFGYDSGTLISYGIMPFMCIDMCIIQGYIFLIRKLLKKATAFFIKKEGKE